MNTSNRFTLSKLVAVVLLMAFIMAEYVFSAKIEAFSQYALYGFEVLFIAIVYGVAQLKLFTQGTDQTPIMAKPYLFIVLGLFLFFGGIIHALAKVIGLMIPYDFTGFVSVALLLIVGPVLEEFVFRGALWKIFGAMFNHPMFMIIASSALFSFSHYYATYSTPAEYHDFILYQTAYTFVLGLACSFTRQLYGKNRGLAFAIAVHFCNNVGFWALSRFGVIG